MSLRRPTFNDRLKLKLTVAEVGCALCGCRQSTELAAPVVRGDASVVLCRDAVACSERQILARIAVRSTWVF